MIISRYDFYAGYISNIVFCLHNSVGVYVVLGYVLGSQFFSIIFI